MTDGPHGSRRRRASFVLQRAATQLPLLAAVLAIVVAGTALLGTCALLLTTAQDQALATAMRHAAPDDVDVTATVRVAAPSEDRASDPGQIRADTTGTLVAALRPFPSTTSTWLASVMLRLPSADANEQFGYLADGEGLADHSRLVAGRWPSPTPVGQPLEVAVLRSTAQGLGLAPGSTTALSSAAGVSRSVVVVGIITPAQGEAAAWERDPLKGAGHDGDYYNGDYYRLSAYGPFVVAPGTLLSDGVGIDRISVIAHPDLSRSGPRDLAQVAASVSAAHAELGTALGDRAKFVAVFSPFPATLAVARTQQAVTGSGALAVALLGASLAATALGLAGRLVVARRAAETVLLSARGASRVQLVRHAAIEAVAVVALATALTIPLTLALYRAVVALPQLAHAELSAQATATPALVLTVAGGAVVLAALLIAPTVRSPDGSGARRRVSGLVARSGADVVLTVVAVLGFVQLRAHRVATSAEIDPVLVAAPVLCLLAGAVLVLRVLPLVARLAEVHASASRALTVPLAGWELARRPHATSGAFLLVLAAAVASFGLSFTQTWSVSQQDQADVEVGADLAVTVVGATPLAQGRALAEATSAVPSPVTARPIGLGTLAGGGPGGVTRLVALDTTQAGELLRGRLPDGQTWAQLTGGLAPAQRAGGLRLPPTDVLTLSISGASRDGTPFLVTPTLIVEDSWGDRVAVTVPGPGVPLDGRPHRVQVPLGLDDGPPVDATTRLVAMDLSLGLGDGAEVAPAVERTTGVTVAVQVVDAAIDGGASRAPWSAAPPPPARQIVRDGTATPIPSAGGATLTATAAVSLPELLQGPTDLVVTAFTDADELPIVVSADLAESLDLGPGDILTLTLENASVPAVVVRVVPYVPSAPRNPAVLADRDALSRAVLRQGDLTSLTDTWWVGVPGGAPGAADAVRAQHLGDPVTRAGVANDLRDGPLRAPLRVAMWLLVAAAVVLSLAGTAVHTAASLEARSVDVARLQGLGVPRRSVIRSFLLQHGVVSLLAVGAGTAVGAVVALAAGPLMVVSATGLAPVPDPRFAWPWLTQGALLGGLLLGSALVAAPVAVRVVRRATVAHLRMDAT